MLNPKGTLFLGHPLDKICVSCICHTQQFKCQSLSTSYSSIQHLQTTERSKQFLQVGGAFKNISKKCD